MDDSPETSQPPPEEPGWVPPPSGGRGWQAGPPGSEPGYQQGPTGSDSGWQPRPGGWYGPPPGPDPYWNPQPPRHGSLSAAVMAVLVAVAVLAGVAIGRSLPTGSGGRAVAGGSGHSGLVDPFGGSGSSGVTGPSGSSGSTGASGAHPGASGAHPGPADESRIAARIDRSLVDIDTNLSYQDEEAAGTGIILNSRGLVLTNNHVIAQATSVRVTDVATGRQYTGSVIGYDEFSDVAVVQMHGATDLYPASIAPAAPRVGEDVVAVGNAGGRGGTPTAAGGTVTGLHQAITARDEGNGSTEKLAGLIRTNAAIQPGDSGGSLVNTRAQVVGMDTAASDTFAFDTSGAEGFAIPIASALRIARQILGGRATASVHVGPTAFIGVKVAATRCGAGGPTINQGSGALVCGVVSGTAASKSGLSADDVILSLAGRAVPTPTALTRLLVPFHPGQRATIVYRTASGARRTTSITFGSGPPA